MKEYASYSIGFLQDFNMVKIESRPQILGIRQAFLNGGENHSGKRIWCLVRVGSSPTASTKHNAAVENGISGC